MDVCGLSPQAMYQDRMSSVEVCISLGLKSAVMECRSTTQKKLSKSSCFLVQLAMAPR